MKKYILGLIILIVVVAGAVFIKNKKNWQSGQSQSQVKPNKVTTLEKSELPKGFYADLPFENGAQVIQNYVSEGEDSVQYTRQILSGNSLDHNFKVYLDYFTSKGVQITAKVDQPDVKAISASLENKTYTITMMPDPVTKKNLINVILLEK